VGLVAPLPPQVGGVASFASWLVANERFIGVRYDTFDLWRPPEDETGGRVRIASIGRQLRQLARFAAWARRRRQLVHYCVALTPTGWLRDALFLALLRVGRRQVVGHLQNVSELERLRSRRMYALAFKQFSRLATEWVALTPSSVDALAAIGISARCIPYPIPIAATASEGRPPAASLRLLALGAYGEEKGSDDLLEAVARARASGCDVVLWLVGKPLRRGDEERLRERAERLGVGSAVRILPPVPPEGVSEHLASAHVICLPSRREGLPLSLIEGMASGLPAIATPVGGIPDLVRDDQNGLLVPVGDIAALSAAIVRLERDEPVRRRLGAQARAHVEGLTRDVASQWARAYASAGSGARTGSRPGTLRPTIDP
jgi:glycosyltransferase involved in cell wall biosynthesis